RGLNPPFFDTRYNGPDEAVHPESPSLTTSTCVLATPLRSAPACSIRTATSAPTSATNNNSAIRLNCPSSAVAYGSRCTPLTWLTITTSFSKQDRNKPGRRQMRTLLAVTIPFAVSLILSTQVSAQPVAVTAGGCPLVLMR